MKFPGRIQIIYLALALAALVTLGYTQARGMRLLNIFSGSLSSYSGHDGPEHK